MEVMRNITVQNVARDYFGSLAYRNLSDVSKQSYAYNIETALNTRVEGQLLGYMKANTLRIPTAQKAYHRWAERKGKKTIPFANHVKASMNKAFNHAIQVGLIENNPFSKITLLSHNPRKKVWQVDQVRKFLQTAYDKFEYRSVGVIFHLMYVWCQRPGDIRLLTFDQYDFDKKVLTLQQSKRRADVYLPANDEIHKILVQQKEDIGFQKYVAPKIIRGEVTSEPYCKITLGTKARKIREEAGLPSDLWIMDMRRTGTTEMVEAGVPIGQIMSVTGHANPQSLKPYMKNTLTSATEACRLRLKAGGGGIL